MKENDVNPREMFKKADRNNDKKIDINELIHILHDLDQTLHDKESQVLFDFLDSNGDGYIDE